MHPFDTLLADDASRLTDAQLVERVTLAEELGRLADALRVQVAAEVAERSRFELGTDGLARRYGHSRASHLLEQLTGSSARDIGGRLSLGRLTRPRATLAGSPLPPLYPAVADALSSGALGTESARAITRCLEASATACTPEQLARAEQALVAAALTSSADLVGVQARIWRDTLDPDGTEPREEVLRGRRALRFGREVDGMARLTIDASGVDLAELRSTFGAYASPRLQPRFRADDDIDPADPFRETRTREQRDFDIFLGLIRAGSRADNARPGPRAAVRIVARERDVARRGVVPFDGSPRGDARRGVAWLDDVDEPVGTTTLDELSCGGETRRAVISEVGAILSLSRTQRLFSESQVVALAIRDGGCIWPHCTAPPSWCDAHHVDFWRDDGPTDVSNGALLCPAHHRLLHTSEFRLRMHNDVPELRAPAHLDSSGRWMPVGKSPLRAVLTAPT